MKPIRCYTCGKILGNKWLTIERLTKEGVALKEVYERIGVKRYCCKRIILTSVDDSVMDTFTMDENIKIHRTNPTSNFVHVV